MKISRDKDSWKASGILRRDFRHTHNGPDEPRHRPRAKNGKRWCRGKEGRLHTTTRVDMRYCEVDRCTECGKNVTYYWKSRWP